MSNKRHSFDFEQFCIDYDIPHKRVNSEWVNINCPVVGCKCSDFKGGFNEAYGFYNCYRCGRTPKYYVIHALVNKKSSQEVSKILKKYSRFDTSLSEELENNRLANSYLKEPPLLKPLSEVKGAVDYLAGRGFTDIDLLMTKYKWKATDLLSDIPQSIYIPVIYDGVPVSYTSRVWRKGVEKKDRYYTCPKDDEALPVNDMLYNIDNASDVCILVEGAFDAVRIGDGAVALLGSSASDSQISKLMRFRKVFIMLDNEPMAQKMAGKICDKLLMCGVDCSNLKIFDDDSRDPADLDIDEVKKLREYCML